MEDVTVNSIIRQARTAGLALIAIASVSAAQGRGGGIPQAQAPQPPNPVAPKLLVPTYRAPGAKAGTPNAKLGTEMAEAVRQAVQKTTPEKDFWVVPRATINQTLGVAGYNADSALMPSDIVALGSTAQVSTRETLDGTVTQEADGSYKLETRFYWKNKLDVTEILPTVSGRDVKAAAETFAASYKEFRKGLPDYEKCENALRNSKNDSAVVYAKAAIAARPNFNLGRLCLISAYGYLKAPPDSIIAVAEEILKRDSTSAIALNLAKNAYVEKKDTAKAVEVAFRIYKLDPSNAVNAQSLVNLLVNSGSSKAALPILDSLITTDPGNVEAYQTKLNVQLRDGLYKDAYETAALIVALDSSAATLDYYKRMAGAAQLDSNSTKLLEYLAKGTKKFPKDAGLQMGYFDALNKAGQLQQAVEAAKRAAEADPKTAGAFIAVVQTSAKLNEIDSAFVWAKKALVAGSDSSTIGQALLSTVGDLFSVAQKATNPTTDDRAKWAAVRDRAFRVDSIISTDASKFFVGYSAAQVALNALQMAYASLTATPPGDKVAVCADLDLVVAQSALAGEMIRAGGSKYSTEAAVAVMTNLAQNAQAPSDLKKQAACSPGTTIPKGK
jgi:tetratricopeptide (TPR) repeat protein